MSGDHFQPTPIEAIKAEQEPISKFKMYVGYLKDKVGKDGATDLLYVDINEINQQKFDFYKKVITFLKSLNAENCNLDEISKTAKDLAAESRVADSDINFGSWLRNELMPLHMVKFMTASWDGDGAKDPGAKGIVEFAISHTDPENLF